MATPLPLGESGALGEARSRPCPDSEAPSDHALAPFRVGSVHYLNAVPLTEGLEREILFAPPSQLAEMLSRGELDAALVSVTAVLLNDRYDILDEVAIASLGAVQSVLLGHRRPISEMTEVYCDTASLTSVRLLEVLLAERGLHPKMKQLPAYGPPEKMPDFVLLIGDPALDFLLARSDHEIWDLGAAWTDLTGLPFVYAVWALRRGLENSRLRRALREAKSSGMDRLDQIIRKRTEYSYEFRKDYLSWHIHYHLGEDEKRGLARFAELLRKHGSSPVFAPVYLK